MARKDKSNQKQKNTTAAAPVVEETKEQSTGTESEAPSEETAPVAPPADEAKSEDSAGETESEGTTSEQPPVPKDEAPAPEAPVEPKAEVAEEAEKEPHDVKCPSFLTEQEARRITLEDVCSPEECGVAKGRLAMAIFNKINAKQGDAAKENLKELFDFINANPIAFNRRNWATHLEHVKNSTKAHNTDFQMLLNLLISMAKDPKAAINGVNPKELRIWLLTPVGKEVFEFLYKTFK